MADQDVQRQTEIWLRALRDSLGERQQPAQQQQRNIERSQAQEQQQRHLDRSMSR